MPPPPCCCRPPWSLCPRSGILTAEVSPSYSVGAGLVRSQFSESSYGVQEHFPGNPQQFRVSWGNVSPNCLSDFTPHVPQYSGSSFHLEGKN